MGGVIIIVGVLLEYSVADLATGRSPNTSGPFLLYLMIGLGLIGFPDDFAEIRKKQSLGLIPWVKVLGQALVGTSFTVMALRFHNLKNRTLMTLRISTLRDTSIDLVSPGIGVGIVFFAVWTNSLITVWSSAINLTDGPDGFAAGTSMIASDAYATITTWQSNQIRYGVLGQTPGCHDVRDPRDFAIAYAATVGPYFGFLWWSTLPAKASVRDTGSLALGGAFTGISILTRTEILAVLIGGLYPTETGLAALQMGFCKVTRRWIFRMAPLHYHFKFKGWKKVTVAIRFWIIKAPLILTMAGTLYAE